MVVPVPLVVAYQFGGRLVVAVSALFLGRSFPGLGFSGLRGGMTSRPRESASFGASDAVLGFGIVLALVLAGFFGSACLCVLPFAWRVPTWLLLLHAAVGALLSQVWIAWRTGVADDAFTGGHGEERKIGHLWGTGFQTSNKRRWNRLRGSWAGTDVQEWTLWVANERSMVREGEADVPEKEKEGRLDNYVTTKKYEDTEESRGWIRSTLQEVFAS